MKKVLILAYYFPPLGMGGTQRAAKFAKYLPDFDWEPIVVSVKDIVYYAKDSTLLTELTDTKIYRTGSLDPQRLFYLLSAPTGQTKQTAANNSRGHFLNKLLSFFFIPDSKILWLPFALFRSWRLIKKENIEFVLTTSPPHSIHFAGLFLKRCKKLKWIADFRDGWSGGNFQSEPTRFHAYLNQLLQKRVVRAADQLVTVSSGLRNILIQKSEAHPIKFTVITNGFDAEDFATLHPRPPARRFEIVFSGALTNIAPVNSFLVALSSLLCKNPHMRKRILLLLVGCNLQSNLLELVNRLELSDCVHFTGYLSHLHALEIVMSADLLLYPVAQDASHDFVPGKTFEYLASGKRILAIGPRVEGIRILEQHRALNTLPHEDIPAIEDALLRFFQEGTVVTSTDLTSRNVLRFERRQLTKQLSQILDTFSENKTTIFKNP